MSYIPQTPFRRAASYVPLPKLIEPTLLEISVDKWDALRAVGTARKQLGLSDRTVGVLQALLSFHRTNTLHGGEVIFASNATICKRLNGMPCSTMRRHLAQLVDAGLIVRRDSPNGKRYVRTKGSIQSAFGFDVSPLAERIRELEALAAKADKEQDMIKGLRQEIIVMKRDIITYIETIAPNSAQYDQNSDFCHLTARKLRRKLTLQELEALHGEVSSRLQNLMANLSAGAADLSINDAQNEHHYPNTTKELLISEPDRNRARISVLEVREHCTEIHVFHDNNIRTWDDLYRAAIKVSPMMGLSSRAWEDGIRVLGEVNLAMVVAVILQRFAEIRSVPAYFYDVIEQGRLGTFNARHFLNSVHSRSSQL